MRFLIPLAVFAVMVIFLAIGLTLDPREVPSPLIGKPAPAFSLPVVADAEQSLSPADFLGQVVLVNVWASWCVSCRQEHPVLLNLAQQNVVPVYGLNYKDQRDAAQGWLRQYGNPYIASAFDADGRAGIDWGVYGVPETFVIDKQGLIRHKHTGPVTPEALEKDILPLVRQLQGEAS
jgi:cytochrome c biogenesis protein CcmG/thiol:disulfide interchange protein DsbE